MPNYNPPDNPTRASCEWPSCENTPSYWVRIDDSWREECVEHAFENEFELDQRELISQHGLNDYP